MQRTSKPFTSAADGRFQSVTRIGAGGMGVVYAAIDTWTARPVALKMAHAVRGGRRAANDQLRREADALSLVDNRHVCELQDVVQDGGDLCLVLERLRGESLQVRLARGRMSTADLLDVAIQVTTALRAIHASGLVHQDIKPANIFVTGAGVVKVLDFGIAVHTGEPSGGGTTTRGRETKPTLMGSPNYVSPERLLRRCADPRSDLFSLGIVLYEMATGVPPFAADTPMEMVLNVLEAQPVPVCDLAPGHPRALATLVHSLLARRPEDRYQSAAAVLRQLQAIRRSLTAGATPPRRTAAAAA
jgi:serine/threonine-protein kinase